MARSSKEDTKGGPGKGAAKKDDGSKKQVPEGALLPQNAQRGIAIAAFVATLAIVYLLQNVAGLSAVETVVLGIVVLVVLVLVCFAVASVVRKSHIRSDAQATCKPILERYRQTGDVRRLLEDYERWCGGAHDKALVLNFTQTTVDALIDTNHEKQARRQLRTLGELIGDDPRGQEEFRKYSAQCEEKLRATKKSARRARR